MPTPPDAPTGNYLARVTVGGAVFEKSLKVEMVRPNRLKIGLDLGTEVLSAQPSDMGGFTDVTFLVKGDRVWTRMKFEGGTHRVPPSACHRSRWRPRPLQNVRAPRRRRR